MPASAVYCDRLGSFEPPSPRRARDRNHRRSNRRGIKSNPASGAFRERPPGNGGSLPLGMVFRFAGDGPSGVYVRELLAYSLGSAGFSEVGVSGALTMAQYLVAFPVPSAPALPSRIRAATWVRIVSRLRSRPA